MIILLDDVTHALASLCDVLPMAPISVYFPPPSAATLIGTHGGASPATPAAAAPTTPPTASAHFAATRVHPADLPAITRMPFLPQDYEHRGRTRTPVSFPPRSSMGPRPLMSNVSPSASRPPPRATNPPASTCHYPTPHGSVCGYLCVCQRNMYN